MTCKKPLALLIPGLDGTGLLYYRQIQALSRSHRVVAWRFMATGEFDLQDLMRELKQVTEGEDPASILVVGESFGGVLAMQYVLDFPQRVRRLILVNTFPYYSRRIRILLGCLLVPLLRWDAAQKIKNLIVDRILIGEGIQQPDLVHYHRIIREVDLKDYRRRLRLVQQIDIRSRLPEIAVPTVILAAGRDKLVPSTREARLIASSIPHAIVHEFPRAGHALLLTPGLSLADYADEGILNYKALAGKETKDAAERREM